MKDRGTYVGAGVAIAVIGCWLACTWFLLNWSFSWLNPLVYFAVLVQMHLFTGLFITAHDAMHGTVCPSRLINNSIGYLSVFLYAGFNYKKLYKKHHAHHQFVHTEKDPDYAAYGFWKWYFKFMLNYISAMQLVIMAVAYNILKIWFSESNLLLFWVLPALLSTFQLFYFGTYLPHKGEHENEHQSATQRKNHFVAFITCYFFGYHLEHHQKPDTPWWLLYRTKP